MKRRTTYCIGIDEVGRGPLAGPVTVCALLLPLRTRFGGLRAGDVPLRDSKKLTPRARERWASYLRTAAIPHAVAHVGPAAIDRTSIARAANRAAGNAVLRLFGRAPKKVRNARILLDAGLRVPMPVLRKVGNPYEPLALVRGDERVPAIALASIAAKVTRDRLMERLGARDPRYGFAAHKGYGTRAHLRALRRHGISRAHRLTFLGRYGTLKKEVRATARGSKTHDTA